MAPLDIVWTRSLLGADRDDYDRFVAGAASGHYAQTRAWEAAAQTTRPSVVRYFLARERDRGRVVGAALVLHSSLGPLRLPTARVERGPVCADPRDVARVAAALAKSARRSGILKLRVMPYWAGDDAVLATRALTEAGFRDSQRPDGSHARTLRIDLLGASDDAFLKGSDKERLRKRWRQAERESLLARRGTREDLGKHRELLHAMMRAQGKSRRSAGYYDALWKGMLRDGSRGALFVCKKGEEVLGTVVVLRHGGLAVYAEGATSVAPSRASKSVPALLAAIRWAREEGCSTFDLGGIPAPDDLDPKRRSIARLKLDFAREPVMLVREHTRIF
jgi:lipid II:glycine glycyltransferase (peptidoglycan interpeptide bridge formation enzyme)